ncbi:uncharacterized protein MYCFIDRAFT_179508 [Pseudocercospora fijiensis CIRAD86]|uniref:F-box domain-containing protein n=1 Tax=Pseudocercospora fijiensis (strain CIRAD86) TaxID=383855 RepID=M3ALN3_PSEFD|nr:uncharacterized protein MYCFIDRAFT_179508 [Pseudocercospora fijiensis CIRAD86]EME78063.1 hypothetical protein MYCFIDRAFT_179508 [Pseudocercospora fijiensis CIRAD86]
MKTAPAPWFSDLTRLLGMCGSFSPVLTLEACVDLSGIRCQAARGFLKLTFVTPYLFARLSTFSDIHHQYNLHNMASDSEGAMTGDIALSAQIAKLHLPKAHDQILRLTEPLPYNKNDTFAMAYLAVSTRATSATQDNINDTKANDADGEGETSPTGFLDLPRELRDEIYELAVVHQSDDGVQTIERATPRGILPSLMSHNVSKLGQVCKQLRQEAFDMFFKYNRFEVGSLRSYKGGDRLGWTSHKKITDLLKRLVYFEIAFAAFPRVYIEQQSDGSWSGTWEDTDWSSLYASGAPTKDVDGIIADMCDAADENLTKLLFMLENGRDSIADAIKLFQDNIELLSTGGKLQVEVQPEHKVAVVCTMWSCNSHRRAVWSTWRWQLVVISSRSPSPELSHGHSSITIRKHSATLLLKRPPDLLYNSALAYTNHRSLCEIPVTDATDAILRLKREILLERRCSFEEISYRLGCSLFGMPSAIEEENLSSILRHCLLLETTRCSLEGYVAILSTIKEHGSRTDWYCCSPFEYIFIFS